MDKWDKRFMELAWLVASWSKDSSTKVGAVVTKGNRVVSLGFNGLPNGIPDTAGNLEDKSRKHAMVIHAEVNAIAFAREDLGGCTIYSTHSPCSHCTGRIIQHGIKRIVTNTPDEKLLKNWAASFEISDYMCKQAGVSFHIMQEDDDE